MGKNERLENYKSAKQTALKMWKRGDRNCKLVDRHPIKGNQTGYIIIIDDKNAYVGASDTKYFQNFDTVIEGYPCKLVSGLDNNI